MTMRRSSSRAGPSLRRRQSEAGRLTPMTPLFAGRGRPCRPSVLLSCRGQSVYRRFSTRSPALLGGTRHRCPRRSTRPLALQRLPMHQRSRRRNRRLSRRRHRRGWPYSPMERGWPRDKRCGTRRHSWAAMRWHHDEKDEDAGTDDRKSYGHPTVARVESTIAASHSSGPHTY